jgi:hypothetical protein
LKKKFADFFLFLVRSDDRLSPTYFLLATQITSAIHSKQMSPRGSKSRSDLVAKTFLLFRCFLQKNIYSLIDAILVQF